MSGQPRLTKHWSCSRYSAKPKRFPKNTWLSPPPSRPVGPTYVFPVIAALADAAIAHGLTPSIALPAACQVVAGTAKLVEETERSPNSLNLMIGTRTLDEAAARKLFMQAVDDAHAKILGVEAKVVAARG